MTDPLPERAIAVIGMAGAFLARRALALWQKLLDGVESITRLDLAEREDDFGAATRTLPNFVPAKLVLDGVELFGAPPFSAGCPAKPRSPNRLRPPSGRKIIDLER
jgi:acyl transferase domain-containing protein